MKGGQEETHKFIDNLEIFSLLANVADGKSLVIHPAATIRLSVGTEHIDDMLANLEKGFASYRTKKPGSAREPGFGVSVMPMCAIRHTALPRPADAKAAGTHLLFALHRAGASYSPFAHWEGVLPVYCRKTLVK